MIEKDQKVAATGPAGPDIEQGKQEFTAWMEAKTKEILVAKAVFPAIARNSRGLNALGGQLLGWIAHRETQQHVDRLRDGIAWLVVHRHTLMKFGVKPRQMDRLLKELSDSLLIFREKAVRKTSAGTASPTNFARLNWEWFLVEWRWCKAILAEDPEFDFSEKRMAKILEMADAAEARPIHQNVNWSADQFTKTLIGLLKNRPVRPAFFLESPERNGELPVDETGAPSAVPGGGPPHSGAPADGLGNCSDSMSFKPDSEKSSSRPAAIARSGRSFDDDSSAAPIRKEAENGRDLTCRLVDLKVARSRAAEVARIGLEIHGAAGVEAIMEAYVGVWRPKGNGPGLLCKALTSPPGDYPIPVEIEKRRISNEEEVRRRRAEEAGGLETVRQRARRKQVFDELERVWSEMTEEQRREILLMLPAGMRDPKTERGKEMLHGACLVRLAERRDIEIPEVG